MLLPRVAKMGYSAILVIGALECKDSGPAPMGPFAAARASKSSGGVDDTRTSVEATQPQGDI